MTFLCSNPKCPKHVAVQMAPLHPGSDKQVLRYAEGFQCQVPKADTRHFNLVSAVWCEACLTARALPVG